MSASETSIALGDGASIDPFSPDPDALTIELIANALSHLCRFGGHTPTFYSVAQHSVIVANMVFATTGNTNLGLAGLLHDATEAVLVDIPRPIKHAAGFETYRRIENALHDVIVKKFGCPVDHPVVKDADDRVLLTERRDLSMYGGALWPDVEPYDDIVIVPVDPPRARELFLSAYTTFARDRRRVRNPDGGAA